MDDTCKYYGVSELAKSLFASSLKWPPKGDIMCQQKADTSVTKEGLDLLMMSCSHGKCQNVSESTSVYKKQLTIGLHAVYF